MKLENNNRPFKVPDNYFEGLVSQMEQIPQQNNKTIFLYKYRWAYTAVASIIALVFIGQLFFNKINTPENSTDIYDSYILSQVSESSIVEYYLTSIDEQQ